MLFITVLSKIAAIWSQLSRPVGEGDIIDGDPRVKRRIGVVFAAVSHPEQDRRFRQDAAGVDCTAGRNLVVRSVVSPRDGFSVGFEVEVTAGAGGRCGSEFHCYVVDVASTGGADVLIETDC